MAHNVVYFDTSTTSVQKFSVAQIDDLAERVLRIMAAGSYTGTISFGTSNPIGTFTDTCHVSSPGGSDTTIVSNTYTLSQITSATLGASPDPPMYVGLDTTGSPTIVLQENLTTLNDLADEILSRMVSGTGGTNSYYLGTTAPADGATWISLGNILDTTNNFTTVINTYSLWKRTTSGATLTDRDPLKLSSGNLQSFTAAEIQALIKIIEQRIVSTGIGTYAFQASVPVTGTWTNVGTVTDSRHTLDSFSYISDSSYESVSYAFDPVFQTNFAGEVNFETVNYTFDPVFQRNFAGNVNYERVAYNLDASYTLTYLQSFNSTYIRTSLGIYNGPGFQVSFNSGAAFDRATPYVGPGPNSYTVTYTGSVNYTGDYTGAINYLATYTGTVNYAGDYTGAVDYVGSYEGTTNYTADYTGTTDYIVNYDGTESYDSAIVGSTLTNISTATLWRRVA